MIEQLSFNNSFALLGDQFCTKVSPRPLINPKSVCVDTFTSNLLGLSANEVGSASGVHICSGNHVPEQFSPLAMVYSGHQFGGYSPELGDGRGLLMGEAMTPTGKWDIHLKGAGKTPYSRFGDGYAVLRSCIREYLASIAMRGLNIPTSHALCITRGDNPVTRETIEPAAMLTRVAKTHVRFGSFEYFYYTQQHEQLKQLADYVIDQFLPEYSQKEGRYNALLHLAVDNTAKLIAAWQANGFCHGVMNTDNMSIIGDTLDYGPYGFMEAYNPRHICNHSDTYGRYAYDQQPSIGLWNLNALAASLRPLIDIEQARTSLEAYEGILSTQYNALLRNKLGFSEPHTGDAELINRLFEHLETHRLDYTLFFRQLASLDSANIEASFIEPLFHSGKATDTQALATWALDYSQRCSMQSMPVDTRVDSMNKANPLYCLRNHYAQLAIDEAYHAETYSILNQLAEALSDPFTERKEFADFTKIPAPELANIPVSCSS